MELFKMGRIFDPVSATEHTSSLDFVDFFYFSITVPLLPHMPLGQNHHRNPVEVPHQSPLVLPMRSGQ